MELFNQKKCILISILGKHKQTNNTHAQTRTNTQTHTHKQKKKHNRPKVHKVALFEALQQQCGVKFSHEIFKSFARNPQEFEVESPLKEADLDQINTRTKFNSLCPTLW